MNKKSLKIKLFVVMAVILLAVSAIVAKSFQKKSNLNNAVNVLGPSVEVAKININNATFDPAENKIKLEHVVGVEEHDTDINYELYMKTKFDINDKNEVVGFNVSETGREVYTKILTSTLPKGTKNEPSVTLKKPAEFNLSNLPSGQYSFAIRAVASDSTKMAPSQFTFIDNVQVSFKPNTTNRPVLTPIIKSESSKALDYFDFTNPNFSGALDILMYRLSITGEINKDQDYIIFDENVFSSESVANQSPVKFAISSKAKKMYSYKLGDLASGNYKFTINTYASYNRTNPSPVITYLRVRDKLNTITEASLSREGESYRLTLLNQQSIEGINIFYTYYLINNEDKSEKVLVNRYSKGEILLSDFVNLSVGSYSFKVIATTNHPHYRDSDVSKILKDNLKNDITLVVDKELKTPVIGVKSNNGVNSVIYWASQDGVKKYILTISQDTNVQKIEIEGNITEYDVRKYLGGAVDKFSIKAIGEKYYNDSKESNEIFEIGDIGLRYDRNNFTLLFEDLGAAQGDIDKIQLYRNGKRIDAKFLKNSANSTIYTNISEVGKYEIVIKNASFNDLDKVASIDVKKLEVASSADVQVSLDYEKGTITLNKVNQIKEYRLDFYNNGLLQKRQNILAFNDLTKTFDIRKYLVTDAEYVLKISYVPENEKMLSIFEYTYENNLKSIPNVERSILIYDGNLLKAPQGEQIWFTVNGQTTRNEFNTSSVMSRVYDINISRVGKKENNTLLVRSQDLKLKVKRLKTPTVGEWRQEGLRYRLTWSAISNSLGYKITGDEVVIVEKIKNTSYLLLENQNTIKEFTVIAVGDQALRMKPQDGFDIYLSSNPTSKFKRDDIPQPGMSDNYFVYENGIPIVYWGIAENISEYKISISEKGQSLLQGGFEIIKGNKYDMSKFIDNIGILSIEVSSKQENKFSKPLNFDIVMTKKLDKVSNLKLVDNTMTWADNNRQEKMSYYVNFDFKESGSSKAIKIVKNVRERKFYFDPLVYIGEITNVSVYVDSENIYVNKSNPEILVNGFSSKKLVHTAYLETPIISMNIDDRSILEWESDPKARSYTINIYENDGTSEKLVDTRTAVGQVGVRKVQYDFSNRYMSRIFKNGSSYRINIRSNPNSTTGKRFNTSKDSNDIIFKTKTAKAPVVNLVRSNDDLILSILDVDSDVPYKLYRNNKKNLEFKDAVEIYSATGLSTYNESAFLKSSDKAEYMYQAIVSYENGFDIKDYEGEIYIQFNNEFESVADSNKYSIQVFSQPSPTLSMSENGATVSVQVTINSVGTVVIAINEKADEIRFDTLTTTANIADITSLIDKNNVLNYIGFIFEDKFSINEAERSAVYHTKSSRSVITILTTEKKKLATPDLTIVPVNLKSDLISISASANETEGYEFRIENKTTSKSKYFYLSKHSLPIELNKYLVNSDVFKLQSGIYNVYVSAIGDSILFDKSDESAVKDLKVIVPILSPKTTYYNGSINWGQVEGATIYHIKASESQNGAFNKIAQVYSGDMLTYKLTYDDIANKGYKYFNVVAINHDSVESKPSNNIRAQIQKTDKPSVRFTQSGDLYWDYQGVSVLAYSVLIKDTANSNVILDLSGDKAFAARRFKLYEHFDKFKGINEITINIKAVTTLLKDLKFIQAIDDKDAVILYDNSDPVEFRVKFNNPYTIALKAETNTITWDVVASQESINLIDKFEISYADKKASVANTARVFNLDNGLELHKLVKETADNINLNAILKNNGYTSIYNVVDGIKVFDWNRSDTAKYEVSKSYVESPSNSSNVNLNTNKIEQYIPISTNHIIDIVLKNLSTGSEQRIDIASASMPADLTVLTKGYAEYELYSSVADSDKQNYHYDLKNGKIYFDSNVKKDDGSISEVKFSLFGIEQLKEIKDIRYDYVANKIFVSKNSIDKRATDLVISLIASDSNAFIHYNDNFTFDSQNIIVEKESDTKLIFKYKINHLLDIDIDFKKLFDELKVSKTSNIQVSFYLENDKGQYIKSELSKKILLTSDKNRAGNAILTRKSITNYTGDAAEFSFDEVTNASEYVIHYKSSSTSPLKRYRAGENLTRDNLSYQSGKLSFVIYDTVYEIRIQSLGADVVKYSDTSIFRYENLDNNLTSSEIKRHTLEIPNIGFSRLNSIFWNKIEGVTKYRVLISWLVTATGTAKSTDIVLNGQTLAYNVLKQDMPVDLTRVSNIKIGIQALSDNETFSSDMRVYSVTMDSNSITEISNSIEKYKIGNANNVELLETSHGLVLQWDAGYNAISYSIDGVNINKNINNKYSFSINNTDTTITLSGLSALGEVRDTIVNIVDLINISVKLSQSSKFDKAHYDKLPKFIILGDNISWSVSPSFNYLFNGVTVTPVNNLMNINIAPGQESNTLEIVNKADVNMKLKYTIKRNSVKSLSMNIHYTPDKKDSITDIFIADGRLYFEGIANANYYEIRQNNELVATIQADSLANIDGSMYFNTISHTDIDSKTYSVKAFLKDNTTIEGEISKKILETINYTLNTNLTYVAPVKKVNTDTYDGYGKLQWTDADSNVESYTVLITTETDKFIYSVVNDSGSFNFDLERILSNSKLKGSNIKLSLARKSKSASEYASSRYSAPITIERLEISNVNLIEENTRFTFDKVPNAQNYSIDIIQSNASATGENLVVGATTVEYIPRNVFTSSGSYDISFVAIGGVSSDASKLYIPSLPYIHKDYKVKKLIFKFANIDTITNKTVWKILPEAISYTVRATSLTVNTTFFDQNFSNSDADKNSYISYDYKNITTPGKYKISITATGNSINIIGYDEYEFNNNTINKRGNIEVASISPTLNNNRVEWTKIDGIDAYNISIKYYSRVETEKAGNPTYKTVSFDDYKGSTFSLTVIEKDLAIINGQDHNIVFSIIPNDVRVDYLEAISKSRNFLALPGLGTIVNLYIVSSYETLLSITSSDTMDTYVRFDADVVVPANHTKIPKINSIIDGNGFKLILNNSFASELAGSIKNLTIDISAIANNPTTPNYAFDKLTGSLRESRIIYSGYAGLVNQVAEGAIFRSNTIDAKIIDSSKQIISLINENRSNISDVKINIYTRINIDYTPTISAVSIFVNSNFNSLTGVELLGDIYIQSSVKSPISFSALVVENKLGAIIKDIKINLNTNIVNIGEKNISFSIIAKNNIGKIVRISAIGNIRLNDRLDNNITSGIDQVSDMFDITKSSYNKSIDFAMISNNNSGEIDLSKIEINNLVSNAAFSAITSTNTGIIKSNNVDIKNAVYDGTITGIANINKLESSIIRDNIVNINADTFAQNLNNDKYVAGISIINEGLIESNNISISNSANIKYKSSAAGIAIVSLEKGKIKDNRITSYYADTKSMLQAKTVSGVVLVNSSIISENKVDIYKLAGENVFGVAKTNTKDGLIQSTIVTSMIKAVETLSSIAGINNGSIMSSAYRNLKENSLVSTKDINLVTKINNGSISNVLIRAYDVQQILQSKISANTGEMLTVNDQYIVTAVYDNKGNIRNLVVDINLTTDYNIDKFIPSIYKNSGQGSDIYVVKRNKNSYSQLTQNNTSEIKRLIEVQPQDFRSLSIHSTLNFNDIWLTDTEGLNIRTDAKSQLPEVVLSYSKTPSESISWTNVPSAYEANSYAFELLIFTESYQNKLFASIEFDSTTHMVTISDINTKLALQSKQLAYGTEYEFVINVKSKTANVCIDSNQSNKIKFKRLANITLNAGVYEIKSADEFASISQDLTGTYKLTADLDFSGATLTTFKGNFSGTLDGANYKISNFKLDTNTANLAIFETNTGTIKNLALYPSDIDFIISKNVEIEQFNIGYLVGVNKGHIENIYISNTAEKTLNVSFKNNISILNIGAVAGINQGTINNVLAKISVEVSDSSVSKTEINIGAIVGSSLKVAESTPTVTNILNETLLIISEFSSPTQTTASIGGAIGKMSSSILKEAVAKVSIGYSFDVSTLYIGGVLGYATGASEISSLTTDQTMIGIVLKNTISASIGGVIGRVNMQFSSDSQSYTDLNSNNTTLAILGETEAVFVGGAIGEVQQGSKYNRLVMDIEDVTVSNISISSNLGNISKDNVINSVGGAFGYLGVGVNTSSIFVLRDDSKNIQIQSNRVIGGVVGINNGYINGAAVIGQEIVGVIAGGVVGFQGSEFYNKVSIKYAYAYKLKIKGIVNSAQDEFILGGLAAIILEAKVEDSVVTDITFDNTNLSNLPISYSYKIGGFVGITKNSQFEKTSTSSNLSTLNYTATFNVKPEVGLYAAESSYSRYTKYNYAYLSTGQYTSTFNKIIGKANNLRILNTAEASDINNYKGMDEKIWHVDGIHLMLRSGD